MRWGTELGPGGPHGTKHREWGALPGVRQPRESGSESGAGPDHTAQKSHLHGCGPSPSRPRPGLEHRREPGAEPAGEARPGGDVRTGRAAEEGHWAVSAGASEVGQLTRSACRPSRSSRGGAGGVCPEPSLLLPDFVSCPSSAQPEGAGQTQSPRSAQGTGGMVRGRDSTSASARAWGPSSLGPVDMVAERVGQSCKGLQAGLPSPSRVCTAEGQGGPWSAWPSPSPADAGLDWGTPPHHFREVPPWLPTLCHSQRPQR